MKVAAVQMKFAPTVEGNLRTIEWGVRQAARSGADVVLFPECAVTGYRVDFAALRAMDMILALARIKGLAKHHRINVLVGAPIGRKNCLIVINRRGRIAYTYAKCHLTRDDAKFFRPGNSIALFKIDGVRATAIICHERRYPELVRLAVMAGARILFHPNAGLDTLAVSRTKRGGRDGIDVRAFENAIFYVFANSVGSQGGGKWSAGDSKIVGPDRRPLALADNKSQSVIVADIDLAKATRKYALDSLRHPKFLVPHWRRIIREINAGSR